MQAICTKCFNFSNLARSNISRKTGERLFRTICVQCEKERKDFWRKNNLEKHNARCLEWSKNNPEKQKQIYEKRKTSLEYLSWQKRYKKEYYCLNKERIRAYTNKRRKKFKQATPKWLSEFDKLLINEIYHLAQLRNQTVDHIVPLQGEIVCGLHVPWNLQLLSYSENFSKSNKFED